MTDYQYDLTISLKKSVPADVLIEHISYALRAIVDPKRRKGRKSDIKVELTGLRTPRSHPFDGPDVDENDQVIFTGKAEEPAWDTPIVGQLADVDAAFIELDLDDVVGAVYQAIGEDFPNLAHLFQVKREEHVARSLQFTDPPAEGDWQLESEDKVGEDTD